jgi:hypothetical protein|tara:strand:- start:130 stop:405 length:276 start_codon:yes stop_codon:yes gene_type:complete
MYLLTLKHRKADGAYAVADEDGRRVLFLFEEEDDAKRYGLMLEDNGDKAMEVIEVDDELAINTCRMYNYKYAVITPDDFVIPPSNDKIQED